MYCHSIGLALILLIGCCPSPKTTRTTPTVQQGWIYWKCLQQRKQNSIDNWKVTQRGCQKGLVKIFGLVLLFQRIGCSSWPQNFHILVLKVLHPRNTCSPHSQPSPVGDVTEKGGFTSGFGAFREQGNFITEYLHFCPRDMRN